MSFFSQILSPRCIRNDEEGMLIRKQLEVHKKRFLCENEDQSWAYMYVIVSKSTHTFGSISVYFINPLTGHLTSPTILHSTRKQNPLGWFN